MVKEHAATDSLAVWPTSDQLSCIYENTRRVTPQRPPPKHITACGIAHVSGHGLQINILSSMNYSQWEEERESCSIKRESIKDLSHIFDLTTHQHNLQLLMIEKYKTKNSLNPTFMRDVFAERNNQHNLRNENHLRLPVAKTTTYGIETIEYRGCLLWSTIPPEIKDSNSLSEFKRKIKKWDGNSCLCRLYKIYVRNLGFL